MSVTLSGFPQSSYVWTARAALALCNVDHDFEPLAAGDHKAPDYLARHPFGKVPALTVDGEHLFETSAILRWAESQSAGTLFPAEALAAAKVEQWISAINAYLYEPAVPGLILKYIFAGPDGPDRATIDASTKILEARLAIFASAIGDGPFLTGNTPTAADLLLGPVLMGISMFPEGKTLLGANPKLGRLIGALTEIPAFMAAAPQG